METGQRTKIEEVLSNSGWIYNPGADSWTDGAIIVDFVNGKCQITIPAELPICGSGETISEVMESARQSLREQYNQNKRTLKILSMRFRNAEQSCEEEGDDDVQ